MSVNDVPPLEDMGHAFKPLTASNTGAADSKSSPAADVQDKAAASTTTESARAEPKAKSAPSATSSFGGMRSGFLAAPSTKQRQQQPQPRTAAPSELPHIRSDPTAAQRSLRLDEVQQSMTASATLDKSAFWLTEELLAKVESDEFLAHSLADPRMSAALAKFQSDPAGAMQEYKDDEPVQKMLSNFSALLGEHFSRLADSQPTAAPSTAPPPAAVTPAVDADVAEVLARPGVREALTNADVQRWMQLMKADPARAQAALRSSRDPEFQRRIRLLFENGLLGLAK